MTSHSVTDLAGVPLLAPEELETVAQLFTVRCYPKGAVLASEGDRLDVFSILRSGRVKFFGRDEAGQRVDVAIIGPGEEFAAQTFGGREIFRDRHDRISISDRDGPTA
jgi:CRP-like cAMP-binding protein